MKALINPNESVNYVESWELNPDWDQKNPRKKYLPINKIIPNSQRICDVAENVFEIGQPLFWIDCANDVNADDFYYDNQLQEIKPIVNEPMPVNN
jgi:hypothetical protein